MLHVDDYLPLKLAAPYAVEPCLDSKFASPFPGSSFVSGSVGLVHMRDLRNKRVIGVRVCQHRADG